MTENTQYSVDCLFNEWEIYRSESFDTSQERDDENLANLLNGNMKNITSKCITCNRDYPFTMESSIGWFVSCTGSKERGSNANRPKSFLERAGDFPAVYTFWCTKCHEKYVMYVHFQRRQDTIKVTKIGQYPDKNTIQGFEFDKYKTLLKKYKLRDDYSRGFLSTGHGYHVASYAYMRRVFEKMLHAFVEEKEMATGKSPNNDRVKDRIAFVSEKFCDDIRKSVLLLYKILSKGVHEMSEEECKENYETLQTFIDIQMAHMEAERQRVSLAEKTNSKIQRIYQRLGGKDG